MSEIRKVALLERLETLVESFEKTAKDCRGVINELTAFNPDLLKRQFEDERAAMRAEIDELRDAFSNAEDKIEDLAEKAENYERLVEVLGDFNHLQLHLILSSADPAGRFLKELQQEREREKSKVVAKVETAFRLMPDDEEAA